MEAVAKHGNEYVKREGRRIQNLLQGKVNKEKKKNGYANSMMITAMLMLREYS